MGNIKKVTLKSLLILIMAVGILTVNTKIVSAKTVKTVTSIKKAKSIKTGRTNINVVKSTGKKLGYVKFKPKKAGTYVFNFSGFKTNDLNSRRMDVNCGFIRFGYKNGKSLVAIPMKQRNGKMSNEVNVCTWDFFKEACSTNMAYPLELPEGRVTLKLKKNQTIYLCTYFSSRGGKVQYTMNIKRKKK